MPTNLVKSKQDEDDWAEARRIVDKQYPDKSPDDKDKSYWKLTTSIYENIKKNRGKKQMQKQASVGELLAGQIRMRKNAAVAAGWQNDALKNIKNNIKNNIHSTGEPTPRAVEALKKRLAGRATVQPSNRPALYDAIMAKKDAQTTKNTAAPSNNANSQRPYLREAYKKQQQQK